MEFPPLKENSTIRTESLDAAHWLCYVFISCAKNWAERTEIIYVALTVLGKYFVGQNSSEVTAHSSRKHWPMQSGAQQDRWHHGTHLEGCNYTGVQERVSGFQKPTIVRHGMTEKEQITDRRTGRLCWIPHAKIKRQIDLILEQFMVSGLRAYTKKGQRGRDSDSEINLSKVKWKKASGCV